MLCSSLIKEYVNTMGLSREDFLFKICPPVTNKYLKRLSKNLFGDKETLAGGKCSELTLYDLRHCSSCYWLPRYKSESALKYRFGWYKSDKINYYSELLGMRDTIKEEDILVDETMAEIEKRLERSEKDNSILHDKLEAFEKLMPAMLQRVEKVEILMKGMEMVQLNN